MNKGDYLSELYKYLSDMPAQERDSAMRFYMEYFDDAGDENEQTVMLQLGTPRQLADQLLAEMGTKRRAEAAAADADAARMEPARAKKRWSWWMWCLVIISSPILALLAAAGFMLLIAVAMVAFMLLLVMMIVAFMPILVSALLVISGVFGLFTGSMLMWREFATSLFFVGSGLVLLGGGALLVRPSLRVLQAATRKTFKTSGWIVRKLRNPLRRKGASK